MYRHEMSFQLFISTFDKYSLSAFPEPCSMKTCAGIIISLPNSLSCPTTLGSC